VCDWLETVGASVAEGIPPEAQEKFCLTAARLAHGVWANILRLVAAERHGGCFLVLPQGISSPASARLDCKYRVASEATSLRQAIHRCACARENIHTGHGPVENETYFAERELARATELVSSLASVDGAVVVRSDIELLGYGAQITGIEPPGDREVAMLPCDLYPGRPERRRLDSFGMRHRAAYWFCATNRDAFAFVISQDGDLTVFSAVSQEGKPGAENPVFVAQPAAEQWL
jgi:hypothetical protein